MVARADTSGIRRIAMGVSALLLAAGLTAVTDAVAPVVASAAQNPTVCQNTVSLSNGAFEQPVLTGTNAQLDEGVVPGWFTTDAQNKIEIWRSGFLGVPSAQGNQFAELNATSTSMLYQDVATTPGQTLSWSLKHRARQGTDAMRVVIGAPGGTLVQNGPNLSDTTAAWGSHSGTYTVPAGQTTTRFGFEAVSTGSGNTSVGNFLDDITFGTGPCLITTKTVTNVTRGGTTAEVGDVLRYTVTTRNDGGNPATASVSADVLDDGLDYVPGSIRIVSGSGVGGLTDAAGDDRGAYAAASRTVQVRLGDAANATTGGSIGVGTSTTYTFDAVVRVDAADTTVFNEAQVAFHDGVGNIDRTSLSNETETPVAQAADLAITKTLETSSLVAGGAAEFTIEVTNNGPHAATGVVVTDAIPAGLLDVQAASEIGSCSGTGTISCELGTLAVDDSTTITISGTVSPSFASGAALTNTASVTGDLTDPVPGNNTATASGTVSTSADLSIEKTFEPSAPVAGGDVVYTLVVHNDGPSDAQNVQVADPLDPETTFVSASSDQGSCAEDDGIIDCVLGTVAAGATVTILITAGLDADATVAVQNSATVSSSTNDPDDSNNTDSTSYQPSIRADLSVTKNAAVAEAAAGEEFDYEILVRNDGPSDAANVVLDDTLPAGLTLVGVVSTSGICGPNGQDAVRCTWPDLVTSASSVVTVRVRVDADAPAGTVINTASVASPAEDATPDNNSASASVEIVQEADLSISKQAPGDAVPGESFEYTLVVHNDGPSTARGVIVADTLPAGFGFASADAPCELNAGTVLCDLGDLAPDAEVEIHIDGVWAAGLTGSVQNTATVRSATPDPEESNNTSTIDKPLVPSADVSVTKTTDDESAPLGGEVTFLVTVHNDGPSTATGVVVSESALPGLIITAAVPTAGSWSDEDAIWTIGALQPDETQTLTVTATVAAVGAVTNAVVVTATTTDPDPTDNTDSATVTGVPSADLAVVKTASVASAVLNAPIGYTITVTNNGPSIAEDVIIEDSLPVGLVNPTTSSAGCTIGAAEFSCDLGDLAVGATVEVSIAATVDPAMSGASLSNTATATSATPDPNTEDNTSTVQTPVAGTPQVELLKDASAPIDVDDDGRIAAGDRIDYTFTIRNTGDVTLTAASIDDPLLGGAVDCAAFDGPLAPGDSVECAPVSYELTQDDLDAGLVHNEASVIASSARGDASDDAEANATLPSVDSIRLVKDADPVVDVDESGDVTPGDTVRYTFQIRNTGTTTLSRVELTDEMLGDTIVCLDFADAQLAPGEGVDCAAEVHEITQEDIDDGLVRNTARVTGDAPNGTVSDTSTVTIDLERTAAVVLSKSVSVPVDANEDGLIGAGDEISYSFDIANTGNTTLTRLVVTDELLGDGALCEIAELQPGTTTTCGPFAYTLTQQDIEDQGRSNTAQVEGSSPIGDVTDTSTVDLGLIGEAAVALTKTAGAVDQGEDGMVGAGDVLDYSFTVRNVGTVLLTGIVIDDPLLGGVLECPALDGLELQPGEEIACGPIAYALTQEDVDSGSIRNVATVGAESVVGTAEDTDGVTVDVLGTDALTLLKSAAAVVDVDGEGRTDAGDTIAYSFTVTNTGTTTLTGVSVADPRLDGEVVCDAVELAPGESTLCSGTPAVLTQAEIDAGEIVNTATATGTGTGENPAVDEDTVTTPLEAQPAIALEKAGGDYVDANDDGRVSAGDTIAFRFTVTNTGARTLTDVEIDDPKLGGALDCDIADLAPGESAACGPIAYTLTAADARTGSVVNVATARASAGGVIVTAADSVTVDVPELATTGGVIVGLGWALALLIAGALVLLIVRLRRRATITP